MGTRLLSENWNVIVQVRQQLSGTVYRVDLSNECLNAPAGSYPYASLYAANMWETYVGTYGKNDTVGFSFYAADPQTQVNEFLNNIYDPSPYGRPYIYDVHLYDNAQNLFISFHNALSARGDLSSFIIGETYYNDDTNGYQISYAQQTTGRVVNYLTQWPLNRNGTAQAPVNDFNNYIFYGF